ncbi:MAG: hypothetical protein QGI50_11340 [Dehalococcoidia bacterium]|nr:hypothetical protein [Dehalococcoidia bacterium]
MVAVPSSGPNIAVDLFRAGIRFCLGRPVLTLVALNLLATLLVYIPLYENRDGYLHLSFSGWSLDNIYRYWDGPLYLVVAQTFYDPGNPAVEAFADLTPGYYAAHLPGYPATIRLFSYIFGYANGMLAATIAATSLAIWVLYQLLKDLGLSRNALWLGVVFLLLPPRWLIYHSVGAAEPLFILEALSFILFFRRKQFWLAGLAGAAAVLTRSPGVLLLAVYLVLIAGDYVRAKPRPSVWSVAWQKLLPMAPFAAAPLLLAGLYQVQYGDFFAYFHSGDNIHLSGAPFASIWPSVLGYNWSEASLWIYLLNAIGILLLWRNGMRDLALFAGAFYVPLIFVAHHDLVRYMLPIFPLTLIIGYERLLCAREFKLAMLLIVPAIYIYTWSGVQTNLAPPEAVRQLLAAG